MPLNKPTLPIQEAWACEDLCTWQTLSPRTLRTRREPKEEYQRLRGKANEGKIVDLIKSLDGTQVMVMVNYIFFKGKTLGLESELPLCRCFCQKQTNKTKEPQSL